MIFNELPIAFPWYDKIEKQNRYNENVEPICDYKLLNPWNGLLPFQFFKSTPGGVLPNLWEIREINTNNLIFNLNSVIAANINRSVKDGKEYFTYYGAAIGGMNLQNLPGYYYSRLGFADGSNFYSEMFHIPRLDQVFAAGDAGIGMNFLRLMWYNNNDLKPIFYNDKGVDLLPKFKQMVYLDSFVTASEPEIVEDGTRDGNDELIPTFVKAIIVYRITAAVPDFLKKALTLLPLHDYVQLTTRKGVRQGEIKSIKVNTALEASGALSIVDILFQEEILLKKGCGENMA